MKAICVSESGGPEVLKLEDMPDPRPPRSGEVLARVNAAGFFCPKRGSGCWRLSTGWPSRNTHKG